MDDKTWLGALAEAEAIAYYTKLGYHVFVQATGKAPFDLCVYKDGQIKRINVKGTTQKTRSNSGYIVELKSVRANKTENKIKKLDPDSYDELFVFVEPLNEHFVFTPEEVNGRGAMVIKSRKGYPTVGDGTALEMRRA